MGEILFPFVYWAQDEQNIFLRVDLHNVTAPDVKIGDKRLLFRAIGEGAKGRNEYNFGLDFYSPISADDSVYKLTNRAVEFTLKKQQQQKQEQLEEKWWPRLTFTSQRPTWLKIDFDKWKDPDAEENEDEDDDNDSSLGRRMRDFDMKSFEEQQSKEMVYETLRNMKKSDGSLPPILRRTAYLLTYNAAMFVGYFIILYQLIRGYALDGLDYFPKAWDETSSKMVFCQIAQTFEVFHSLVGYVKSPWTAPFMQVSGRGMVLFLVLVPEQRLHEKPFIFYLFAVWSLIEVIRYPYYFLSILGVNIDLITWLRYTMWIPLYPLGMLCEGIIIIRALVYYDETAKFSLPLPNALNVSFDFGLFLRFYLLLIFMPGMIYLLRHMRKQRLAKLCTKQRQDRRRKTTPQQDSTR